MILRVKKIIMIIAGIIFIATLFLGTSLSNSYVNNPKIPNPKDGKIIPYAVKNIVVYVTEEQQSFLSLINWIAFSSGMAVALVMLIHKGDPFRSKK